MARTLGLAAGIGAVAGRESSVRLSAGIFRRFAYKSNRRRGLSRVKGLAKAVDGFEPVSAICAPRLAMSGGRRAA